MDDQNAWRLFLKGDKDALSHIFLDYYDDLFNYGRKLSNNQDIAKDSIQDLFLKLWKNRNNLKSVQIVKPYLFKSLRHHIQDSLELRKPWQSIDNDYDPMFPVVYSHEDFLINNQVTEESRIKVIEVLNKLTPRQREAIYLRFFEDLDFEIISQIMEMNIQSVRNTIHRAMQVMRELMVLQIFLIMLEKVSSTFEILKAI
jgi:RNA polymerase sigma-70 factor (ECF subfamily)